MSNPLVDHQRPLDAAIARALLALTPEEWARAGVQIDQERAADGTRLYFTFTDPTGAQDHGVEASPELVQAAAQLLHLYAAHGHRWQRVTYTVQQEPDGRWWFGAEFEY